MTPSELKYAHEQAYPDSTFFSLENMKFAGDTMRNYGVLSTTIETWTDETPVEVWELYRKRPVKYGLKHSAYFRKDNLKPTFCKQ